MAVDRGVSFKRGREMRDTRAWERNGVDGRARLAVPYSGRCSLTKWSSAASEASPLQRRVRPRGAGEREPWLGRDP